MKIIRNCSTCNNNTNSCSKCQDLNYEFWEVKEINTKGHNSWSNLMANLNGFNSIEEQEEWINKGCPETLEEVAEQLYNSSNLEGDGDYKDGYINGVIAAYKHVESKMYSIENLQKILLDYTEAMWADNRTLYSNESMRNWFNEYIKEFNNYKNKRHEKVN